MKRFILIFTAISFVFSLDASASNHQGIWNGFKELILGVEEEQPQKEKNKNNTSKVKKEEKKISPRSTNLNLTQPKTPLFSNEDINLNLNPNNTNRNIPIEREKSPPLQDNEASLIAHDKNSSLIENTTNETPNIPVEIKKTKLTVDNQITPVSSEITKEEQPKVETPPLISPKNEQLILPPQEKNLIVEKKEEILKPSSNTPVITSMENTENSPKNEQLIMPETKKEEKMEVQTISTNTEIISTTDTNQLVIEEKKSVPSKGILTYVSERFQSQSGPEKFIDLSLKMVLQSLVKYNKTLNGASKIEILSSSEPFKVPNTDEEKYLAFTKGQYNVELPCQSVFKLQSNVHYVMYNEQDKFYELIKITEFGIPTPKGLVFEKTDSGTDIHYHIKSITITNKTGKVKDQLFDVLTSKGFSESLASAMQKAPKTFRENLVVNEESVLEKTGLLYTLNDLNLDYKIEAKSFRNVVKQKSDEITDLYYSDR